MPDTCINNRSSIEIKCLHRNDIRIARDIAYGDEAGPAENFQQTRLGQARSTDVKLDYSLRQYVSVLYKVSYPPASLSPSSPHTIQRFLHACTGGEVGTGK